jgi:hypothetical protein
MICQIDSNMMTPRMFADDTSLTAVGKTLNEAED